MGSANYAVKVISPLTADSGVVKKWDKESKFSDVSIMKNQLSTDFAEFIKDAQFSFGYIQPGHGAKGRQQPLEVNEDLSTMYSVHSGKKQIILWVKVIKGKRPLAANNTGTKKQCKTNHEGHLEKMSEVQIIVEELQERHGSSKKYSDEQLRAWAHMIQLKKHDSYETPPDKPFFKSHKKAKVLTENSLSPGKRISYRTECIEQLDKWHSLMEKGAISQTQFQEMQERILGDIKQL